MHTQYPDDRPDSASLYDIREPLVRRERRVLHAHAERAGGLVGVLALPAAAAHQGHRAKHREGDRARSQPNPLHSGPTVPQPIRCRTRFGWGLSVRFGFA